MKFNNMGKQITFLCNECGKEYTLEDLRYFDGTRVCINCKDKFWEKQKDEARKINFNDHSVLPEN